MIINHTTAAVTYIYILKGEELYIEIYKSIYNQILETTDIKNERNLISLISISWLSLK